MTRDALTLARCRGRRRTFEFEVLIMKYDDIVPPSDGGGLSAYDDAQPAPEYTPVPPGIYTARIVRGEYGATKAGADAYRMRFEISEGPQKGRTVIRVWTFTPKAINYTKRELTAFGLTTQASLLSPFPPPGREYTCHLYVAVKMHEGTLVNEIKKIEILRVEKSAIDDYVVPDLPTTTEGGTP